MQADDTRAPRKSGRLAMFGLLATILLLSQGLTSCATANLHAMGRRDEYADSIDAVRKDHSGSKYLVEYTNTVSCATWGSVNRLEKRYQIMEPGTPLAKPLKTLPAEFADAKALPLRRVREASEVHNPRTDELERAYVVYKNDVVLLIRSPGKHAVTRMELPCADLEYREGWAYPVEAIAAPVTIVIDIVTLPIQIGVMAAGFKH